MIPIVSLLIVPTISLIVTRVAAVALVHTGLSREVARFQARSAFTGVGFTTTESENIVGHHVRVDALRQGGYRRGSLLDALSFIGLESGASASTECSPG